MTVQNSGALEAEINPAGTINVSQFNDALYSTALITVPTSGWSGSAPKFTRSIPVDGITSTSMPFVELKYPDNVTEEQKKAVDRAASKLVSLTTTNAGLVTLTATEVPTTSFQLMLRGLGSGQYTPDQSDIIYSVITKQEPYVERVGIDGLAKMELVGGTVAWNQLVQNGNFATQSLWTPFNATYTVNNNIATITKTNGIGTPLQLFQTLILNASHRYFVTVTVNPSVEMKLALRIGNSFSRSTCPANTKTTFAHIKSGQGGEKEFNIYGGDEVASGSTLEATNAMCIDLTQMFGTTIADYVYSLEQSVEGSGIAWLKSYGFFTKDYYAYDAGSLQSVCTSGRKVTDLSGNERTYPIDDVQLRGLFKLDTNNKLYCDGDIYKSSGNVTRNYETRAYQSGDESLTDAITDGTNTVVKLAAPTTETADPYINPQRSLADGTEEFVDGLTRDVMVPVGNVTQYYQSEIIPIISEYIDAVMASN
jgi:hypothetical protein